MGPSASESRLAGLSSPSGSGESAWPAALRVPWAERSGFDASRLAAVRDPTPAAGDVSVALTFWPKSPDLFSTGGSPPLSASAVGDRYGLSNDSYIALERFFESRGLRVLHTWPDRLQMTVDGSAPDVEAAFRTSLIAGQLDGRPVRLPASPPSLPPPFSTEVAAVSGLESGLSTFSIPLARATVSTVPAQGRTSNLVTPSGVHLLYGLDKLYNYSGSPHWARGQSVVLLLWGSGYDPSDIRTFFARYYPSGFPPPTVMAYPIDGAPAPSSAALSDPSNAPQELTLDIEWAGSAAPGATLDAVYAPDGPASNNYSPTDASMEDALAQAVNSLPNVTALSMSFGTPDGSDAPFQAAFQVDFGAAKARGITVFASSGDNGGTQLNHGACTSIPSPEFPASSPDVVAVGGSDPQLSVSTLGTVTGLASESAWNLSGGGYSSQYAAPSWQLVGSAGSLITANGGFRGIPDVAGPAADDFFYYAGAEAVGQGTSFPTPLWAGMIAEMNAIRGVPFGFLTPRLYAVAISEQAGTSAPGLSDITTGSNCLGPARVGWDTATGWGSPRALLLYEDLSATYVSVRLNPASGSLTPGQTFQATVVVRNATSHVPISGLPVNVTLGSASDYVGPCGGQMASGTALTDASGSANVSVTVSSCFLGTTVDLAASVLAGGYFGSNQTSLGVNLLSFSGFVALLEQFPYNLIALVVVILIAIAVVVRVSRRRRRRAPPAVYAAPAEPTWYAPPPTGGPPGYGGPPPP
jgi:kumamolisin